MKAKTPLLDIQIIGSKNSGKSSLLLKYADDTFSNQYLSTIGVDFKVKTNSGVRQQIWDSTNDDTFRSIKHNNHGKPHAYVITVDMTDPDWKGKLSIILQETRNDAKIFLVGTKSDDIENLKVSESDLKKFAKTSINSEKLIGVSSVSSKDMNSNEIDERIFRHCREAFYPDLAVTQDHIVDLDARKNKTSFFQRNFQRTPFLSVGLITSVALLILGVALSFIFPGLGTIIVTSLIVGLKGITLSAAATTGILGGLGVLIGTLGTLLGKAVSLIIDACSPKNTSSNIDVDINPGRHFSGLFNAKDLKNGSTSIRPQTKLEIKSSKNSDQDYNYLLKIQIIGSKNSGKSSLLLKYADDTFSNQHLSTIGVDFKIKINSGVRQQIWDSTNDDTFRSIKHNNHGKPDAYVITVDMTDPDWKDKLSVILQETRNDAKIFLVGTKSDDIENIKVSESDLEKFAKESIKSEKLIGVSSVSSKDMNSNEIDERVFDPCRKAFFAPDLSNTDYTVLKGNKAKIY